MGFGEFWSVTDPNKGHSCLVLYCYCNITGSWRGMLKEFVRPSKFTAFSYYHVACMGTANSWANIRVLRDDLSRAVAPNEHFRKYPGRALPSAFKVSP